MEISEKHRTLRFLAALEIVDCLPVVPEEGVHEQTHIELETYLDLVRCGAKTHFPEWELTKMKYPVKAGAESIVPPLEFWPRLAFLQWFADRLRWTTPIDVAHIYRPEPYNAAVGSTTFNHVNCCAIDLDFRDDESFEHALRICESLWRSPLNLHMGLGVGRERRRLHVDFFTVAAFERVPPSKRWWRYDHGYNGPLGADAPPR